MPIVDAIKKQVDLYKNFYADQGKFYNAFYLHQNSPGRLAAPQRDWEVPQLAGYENHPFFKTLKTVAKDMPSSDSVSDVELRKYFPQDPTQVGNYDRKTQKISIMPVTEAQTKRTAYHEYAHHLLDQPTEYKRLQGERSAKAIAEDKMAGKPIDQKMLTKIYDNPLYGRRNDPKAVAEITQMINKADENLYNSIVGTKIDKGYLRSRWK